MFVAIDDKETLTYIEHAILGRDYFCPLCRDKVSIKRGEERQHCFSHFPGRACSDSWDREYDISEWHREWQQCFPICNQEVVVQLGEIKHRADVLTGKTVIEFQHSALSTDSFNKRNSFYQDLGYKVVWLFDLNEEFKDGSLKKNQEKENCYIWNNPKRTFNKYDLSVGQIELFFQLENEGENCIVKIKEASSDGFKEFFVSDYFDKETFLNYFNCTNGICPEPYREDIKVNEKYLGFKDKYSVELDEQQERAAQSIEGANLILAVPGSGKTTTLIARIGYMVNCLGINGDEILALTYTKKAAAEMEERFHQKYGENAKAHFMTINSLASWIMGLKYSFRPEVIDNNERNKIIRNIYLDVFKKLDYPTENDIKVAGTSITYIKNMMLNPDEQKKLVIWYLEADKIYNKYEEKIKESGKIDFDDQLVKAYEILKKDQDILEFVQGKFKYICVDEAQDTSKIQYEIMKLLVEKNHNIFMVGDEDQSIYRFRAAYPQALLNFKTEFPNPFILKLETNYRSKREIVDLASEFIAKNANRYPKRMISVKGSGGRWDVIDVDNREEQYRRIEDIAKKTNKKTAILYRDNVCAIPLIDRFIKLGISFQLKKMEDVLFFHEHVVNDVRAFLKLSINENDNFSFREIYYKCKIYINKKDANGIFGKMYYEKKNVYQAMKEWLTYNSRNEGQKAIDFEQKIKPLATMKPADALNHIFNNGYGDYLQEKANGLRDFEILLALAREDETIQDFFNHLDRLEKQIVNLDSNNSIVILSTVHSSKGLEYDSVILLDVYDGIFPSGTSDPKTEDEFDQLQEERRLFYVAMTRAKDELTFYRIANKPSSFLLELSPVWGVPLVKLLKENSHDFVAKQISTEKTYIFRNINYPLYDVNEIDIYSGEIKIDTTIVFDEKMLRINDWKKI